MRVLTAANAGYHGAHAAIGIAAAAKETKAPPTVENGVNFLYDNVNLYYCWTHGLGLNPTHTSATCTHPADGHKEVATLMKRMGGSGRIMFGDHTGASGHNKCNQHGKNNV